jgi:hypothetical protein
MQKQQVQTAEVNELALNLTKGDKFVINHNYLDDEKINAADAIFVTYSKDKSKMQVQVGEKKLFRWYPVCNFISCEHVVTEKQRKPQKDKDMLTALNTATHAPVMKVTKSATVKKTATDAKVVTINAEVTPSLPGQGEGVSEDVYKAVLKSVKSYEKKAASKAAYWAKLAVELLKVGANKKQLKQAGIPDYEVSDFMPVYHYIVVGKSTRDMINTIIAMLKDGTALTEIKKQTGHGMSTISKTSSYYKYINEYL